jgi:Alginate lyase
MVALVPALLLPNGTVDASPTRPAIVARKAGPDARVSILATVAVRFDRPVVGISDETFVLRDARGRVVPANVYYNPSKYRAALIPVDALRAGERYRASLSTEIRTPAGVALSSSSWTFKTARQPAEATRFERPRAVRFAPGRVTGIQVNAQGRVISSVTARLASHSWAMADAIAVIRGRSYYDISNGMWAGHFVPAEAIVDGDGPGEGPGSTPAPSASASPSPEPSGPSGPSPSAEPTAAPSTPAPTPQPTPEPPVVQPPTAGSGILISSAELRALPTSGGAWDALKRAADAPAGRPNLADMNQENNVQILAKALVYARTGTASYRAEVIAALRSVMGTEAGAETLSVGRELAAYVISADLIGLSAADPGLDATFRSWLRGLLDRTLADGSSISSVHERRPNNWGTHNGASRAAAAAYLGDQSELSRVAAVFRGWVGERQSYAGFKYADLWWQSNPGQPVGINPPGATIKGHSVDGVLPEEQRRTGEFTWPPPCGNYPHGALDGALLTAEILHRRGYAAYGWGSQALLRAQVWLHSTGCAPSGDNVWHLPLVDARYGTNFWNGAVLRPGKNFGWTDWLYGR